MNDDCVKCAKLRKRYIEVETGPVAEEQLVIAPPFWTCMVDLFGPYKVYQPGCSYNIRGKKAVDANVYVLCFVCPTTKMVNLQVIESRSADGICEGITRMSCEQGGVPNYVLVDQDSAIMKVLNEAEISMKNLHLFKEKGIQFK